MSDGKYLVVVESPAKAKTISRFLDSSYQVEASYGHVRDLPQNAKEIPAAVRGQDWARMGVNIDEDFAPVYVIPSDKRKHVQRLKDALKSAEGLLPGDGRGPRGRVDQLARAGAPEAQEGPGRTAHRLSRGHSRSDPGGPCLAARRRPEPGAGAGGAADR